MFFILNGDDRNQFSIELNMGLVKVNKPLDREKVRGGLQARCNQMIVWGMACHADWQTFGSEGKDHMLL